MALEPSVERFSVTLGEERDRNELVTVRSGAMVLLGVALPVTQGTRSVPRVVKLDGRVLEKPFSSRVLISVDGRYWYMLLPALALVAPGVIEGVVDDGGGVGLG